MHLITVRQTLDPYVNDIQYVASHEVLLERNGSLSMTKIGLGMPGDNFVIISREEQPGNPLPVVTVFTPPSDIVRPDHIRMMTSCKDGPHPILTLVESGDNASGFERHQRRIDARERAKQLAYLKGLVTHAWNWVAPVSPSVPSSRVMSTGSQRRDSIPIQPGNADSDSTCVADIGNPSRLVHRHRTAKVADSGSWTG